MKKTTAFATAVILIVVVIIGVYAFMTYGSGSLQILMTDPPTEWDGATQVYINYSAIEVHRADAGNESGWFTVVGTGTINLTQILDVNKTIGSNSLQAGLYNLIRFSILNATVTVNGVNHTAVVPPNKLQIAITQGGIQINAVQTSRLLIELNIRVEATDGGYRIVPDIRAMPM